MSPKCIQPHGRQLAGLGACERLLVPCQRAAVLPWGCSVSHHRRTYARVAVLACLHGSNAPWPLWRGLRLACLACCGTWRCVTRS